MFMGNWEIRSMFKSLKFQITYLSHHNCIASFPIIACIRKYIFGKIRT